jgi:hypothetical protein
MNRLTRLIPAIVALSTFATPAGALELSGLIAKEVDGKVVFVAVDDGPKGFLKAAPGEEWGEWGKPGRGAEDLEGLADMGGNRIWAVSSTGMVYPMRVKATTIKRAERPFELERPNASRPELDIEGFTSAVVPGTVVEQGSRIVLWASRGDGEYGCSGELWGGLVSGPKGDIQNVQRLGLIEPKDINGGQFCDGAKRRGETGTKPDPKTDSRVGERAVGGLYLREDGTLFATSTRDRKDNPGAKGPLNSSVYVAGKVSVSEGKLAFEPNGRRCTPPIPFQVDGVTFYDNRWWGVFDQEDREDSEAEPHSGELQGLRCES